VLTYIIAAVLVCVCLCVYMGTYKRERMPITMWVCGYKVVCSWCGRHMRGAENAQRTSHGMCPQCHANVLSTVRGVRTYDYGMGRDAWAGTPSTDKYWYQNKEGK